MARLIRTETVGRGNPMSDYMDDLRSDLKDPEYAAEYLTAARRESRETFLLALRDVAEAQKGMTKVAPRAGVNRENLYRMLSEGVIQV
jgi:probable addiction module antidote protein